MVENATLTEMPSDELLEQRIDRYLDEHWEDIVADIDRLVRIPSFEDLGAAAEGAPYGPGPRKALDAALAGRTPDKRMPGSSSGCLFQGVE